MILWFTPKKGISPAVKELLVKSLVKHGVKPTDILFMSLHHKVPTLSDHTKRKMPSKAAIHQAKVNIDVEMARLKPTLIVINDEDTLRVITGQKYTLGTVRGSKYYVGNTPAIVLDNLDTLRYVNHAKQTFQLDLMKIVRHVTGKTKQEPYFHFVLCRTVDDVKKHRDVAEKATMISLDTETAGGFVTVESFTYDDPEGRLVTCCVPYFDPHKSDGAYWETFSEEKRVRLLMAEVHRCSVYKALQNGTYDCAYYIKEMTPLINYFVDTQNLMHSIWVEMPKALHELASYWCDCYTYWKDDKKGIQEDGWGKDYSAVHKYWRYNGLDTYYTWLVAFELLKLFKATPYAAHNYNIEFSLSIGPCLAASLRGFKVDRGRHSQIMSTKLKAAHEGVMDLERLTGEVGFNLRSPAHVAWFLYDVLGAKKTRIQRANSKYGDRSTDEKVLKLIKEQNNPVINNFINRLLRAKEPATLLSNFGNLQDLCYKNGRFLSWHNAAGTETGRFNSGSCQFWTGRNGQNWQPEIKEFVTADEGYFFCELDWSSSDDYFIAHEAQDTDKIELLLSGKDPHSWHAHKFFSRPYDEIIAGKKAKARWVIHAIEGVRQSSKKIVHGKNFMMGPAMMYNLMGRDAVVATAKALGHSKAANYTDKELIGICQELMEKYDNPRTGMYRRIRPWQSEIIKACAENNNLATCAFGMTRKFFGDVPNMHNKQRELCAFYGQGGTAGNANRALKKVFYSGVDDGQKCIFLVQNHDSLVFLIHRTAMHKIQAIKDVMEEPCTLHGRTFRVPVSAKVGLTWSGDNMAEWYPNMPFSEIEVYEEKAFAKKFPKHSMQMLETLASLNFDDTALAGIEEDLAKFEAQDLENENGEFELTDEE